jgi:hypothetical protein
LIPSDRAYAHATRPGEALRVTFEWIFCKEHELCYTFCFPYFFFKFFPVLIPPPYFFSCIFFYRNFFPVLFFSTYFFSRIFFTVLFFPVLFSRTFSKVATFEIQRIKISVSCFFITCRYNTVHVPCRISIQTSPVGLPLDGWRTRMRDLKGSTDIA